MSENRSEVRGTGPRKVALVLEYRGTRYQGFQIQPHAPTIQGELEKALERFTGEKIRVKGASRTDAGVHARGQVVAFTTAALYSTDTFVRALNYYLPKDIAVKAAYDVAPSFDPRRQARARLYRYLILNSPTPSPLLGDLVCHIIKPLDVEKMQEAAQSLVGVHDFSAFAGWLDGKSPVRRVYRAQVGRRDDLVVLEMEANAFLPQQVRRTAGALVQVGLGEMPPREFKGLLRSPQPAKAGPLLPASGLCLMEVRYPHFPPQETHEEQ